MPKTILTPKMEVYIKANYLIKSGSSISEKLGVGKGVIYRFEKKNNLIIPNNLKKKFRLEAFLKAKLGSTTFTKEEDAFILKNYLKMPVKTIANKLGRSGRGIYGALDRMNLIIPQELADKRKKIGMYRKGSVPANKGKKQTEYMSCEAIEKTKATRFKKGQIPHNSIGINNGDIHIRKYSKGRNYKWIRIKLGKWMMLHVHNWEQKFGPIPKGYILRFIDNNSMNCNPDNMELITRKEHMGKNTIHRYPTEIKENIRLISKIKKQIN